MSSQVPSRCRATLAPLRKDAQGDGFSEAGLRQLTGSRRALPWKLGFTRADVIRHRAQAADRMSIPGVQDKILLRLEDGRLVPTDADGEYLLKPIPGAPLPRMQADVPANEHVTMRLAAQVFAIETAVSALVELADGEPAYLVRRFDRRDGARVDMEDFCSLAGRTPETHGRTYKYDGSYEELGRLVRRHCPAHRIECERLFARIVFSYAVGNGDAHLKNFSLFRGLDGDPVLTPAYDLVCTTLHIPDESRLALPLFADDHETEAWRAHGFETGGDFLALAARLEVLPRRASAIISKHLSDRTAAQVRDLVGRSFLSPEAKEAYLRIVDDRRVALGIGVDAAG